MKNLIFPGLVLFTLCANAFSQEAPEGVPRLTVAPQAGSAEGVVGNILPEGIPYKEFLDHLKAAIETRDTNALQNLYQTNGVSSEQLRDELNRWRPMLEPDDKSRLSIEGRWTMFRDFSRCSPTWKNFAERVSSHKSTHLVQLMTSRGSARGYWMLPLVMVEGRLFLVPCDKSRDMGLRREDIEWSLPGSTNANSSSGAPDSHR
jgi:hypothetical protein